MSLENPEPAAPKLQLVRTLVVDYDRRPTFNQLCRDLGWRTVAAANTVIVYFEGDVWVAKDRSGQHQGMWA